MVVIFVYADPPYIGCAHLYKADPNAAEVDHEALIARLSVPWIDGWALSCSAPSLRQILPHCPEGSRVCSWVKPFASFKPNVGVAYTWEPVILFGGRKRTRQQPTVRDHLAANITLRKGLCGAKPPAFCAWVFDLFNAQPGDDLIDVYPGTGGVSRAWGQYFQRGLFDGP